MKYVIDHDLHIHSNLSRCSSDPEQTPSRILNYAAENGFKQICLTNHFWDERVAGASAWYSTQDYPHIKRALPLPQRDGIEFLFGCETELDKNLTLGISREVIDEVDFVIIPTTHMHMEGFTIEAGADLDARALAYVRRLDAVLSMDLPFYKIGIAHLTCPHIAKASWWDHIEVIDRISDADFERMLLRAAEVGVGIELNFSLKNYSSKESESILRPYRIAKSLGCKFYFGSDAHDTKRLAVSRENFRLIAEALELSESDKFIIKR